MQIIFSFDHGFYHFTDIKEQSTPAAIFLFIENGVLKILEAL